MHRTRIQTPKKHTAREVEVLTAAIEKLYSERFEIFFDIVKREQLKTEALFDYLGLRVKRARHRLTLSGLSYETFVCVPKAKKH